MFKNHPKGMVVLFFTEMWERFGFYIMMAIYVLYMEKEFGWSDSKKGDFYGTFLLAVYFLPILGGWLGDKFLGQINTIRIGSISMVFGYIALAVSARDWLLPFYAGLVLVAFGTGIFKVNMSVLVGNLYREKVHLKDAGFNIYYMGVNVGAALAPLAATFISIAFESYRLSFWAAAIGMSLSLLILQTGKRFVSMADTKISPVSNHTVQTNGQTREIPKTEELQRIITLVILFLIVIFFWIAFYQNGFALTLFAKRSTLESQILRPETYQFFNPMFILILTPILLSLFAGLNRKKIEPSTPAKIFYGLVIMGFSMLVMVLGSWLGGNADVNIMSPAWLITTYLIMTLAEILISPMGQSFVSKVSPPRIQGLMMGLWFGATAVGSFSSGIFGKLYSSLSHHLYFLILAGLLFFSSILVLFAFKKLKKFAH
ncbi:MAG: peptide MFS transporter [bacterium]|nr:MAG: peptide MFS transporter [bacterium]